MLQSEMAGEREGLLQAQESLKAHASMGVSEVVWA